MNLRPFLLLCLLLAVGASAYVLQQTSELGEKLERIDAGYDVIERDPTPVPSPVPTLPSEEVLQETSESPGALQTPSQEQ